MTSGGGIALLWLPRSVAKRAGVLSRCRASRFDAYKKRRKTPAKRQPSNIKRRRAAKNLRKRTAMDLRRSSMEMPPGASQLERGGREFLHGKPHETFTKCTVARSEKVQWKPLRNFARSYRFAGSLPYCAIQAGGSDSRLPSTLISSSFAQR